MVQHIVPPFAARSFFILASVMVTACGSASSHAASSTAAAVLPSLDVSSLTSDIFKAINSPTLNGVKVSRQALADYTAKQTFADLFAKAYAQASDRAVTLDGVQLVSNAKQALAANRATYMALDATYPNIGAFFRDTGVDPANVTQAAYDADLAKLAAQVRSGSSLGLDIVPKQGADFDPNAPQAKTSGRGYLDSLLAYCYRDPKSHPMSVSVQVTCVYNEGDKAPNCADPLSAVAHTPDECSTYPGNFMDEP